MKKLSLIHFFYLSLILVPSTYGMEGKKPTLNFKYVPKTVRWLAGMGIPTGAAVWYFGKKLHHTEEPEFFRKLFGYPATAGTSVTFNLSEEEEKEAIDILKQAAQSVQNHVKEYQDSASFITPSQKALEKCLRNSALQHFDEKTKFSKKYAEKTLVPLGVLNAVNLAKYDYAQYFNGHPQRDILLTSFEMNSDSIVRCMAGHSKRMMNEIQELQRIVEKA